MEGVDVLEHRALGEQHQVGVAARADRGVGAQAAVEGVVLAGGEELPFILRPRLGVAALPGGIELEERELGKRAICHRGDASASLALALACAARRRPPRRDEPPRGRSPCCRTGRRSSEIAGRRRSSRRAWSSAGPRLGAGGADLPRHQPGQPGQRGPLRRATSRALYVRDGDGAARGSGTAIVARADERARRRRPRPAGSTLERRRRPGRRRGRQRARALIGVDARRGGADRGRAAPAPAGCGPGLTRRPGRARSSCAALVDELGPGRPADRVRAPAPRAQQQLLPAGIAGEGFDGNLTSASTRTDGRRDLTPTSRRPCSSSFGVEVPDEMNGSEITSERRARRRARSPTSRTRLDRPAERATPSSLRAARRSGSLLDGAGGARVARARARGRRCACWRSSVAWAPLILLAAGRRSTPASWPSALAVGLGAPALARCELTGCSAPCACAGVAAGSPSRAYARRRRRRLAADRALGPRARTRAPACASSGSATSSRRS